MLLIAARGVAQEATAQEAASRLAGAALADPVQAAVVQAAAAPLRVEADLPEDGWIGKGDDVALQLSRPLQGGERLAVFLDVTDVTDLFRRSPQTGQLRYTPGAVRLPSGEHSLVFYRVVGDQWEEISQVPLRVRGTLGLETSRAAFSLDGSLEGQLAEGHDPASAAPPRSFYQDFSGQANVEMEATRGSSHGTVKVATIGVSHQQSALRFGLLGEEAPRFDLSNYTFQAEVGSSRVHQGHVSLGSQRHLISGFSSRGTLFEARPSQRVDAAAGMVNGSSVVGWSNFFGLDNPEHRIYSGSLGLELLERAGALRLELSGMGGSVLPRAGFNQGVVNDAEQSRGFGAVMKASDASGRLRLEGGFARSMFDNPFDPTLSLGSELVPVERETSNARYVDASVAVLRNRRLAGTRTVNLTVGWQHERVDPLYRSVAAFVSADQLQNRLQAQAQVAGVNLRADHARSEDNLDEIPSILKSKTRRSAFNVGVPLPTVLARTGSPWLPRLAWGIDLTHQFGDAIPVGGGFDPSQIPDQGTTRHTASADWTVGPRVSFGYRLSYSNQDNRQPGREAADFTNRNHAWSANVQPRQNVSLNLSLALEEAENHERAEVQGTRRIGVRGNWSPFERSTLAGSISRTLVEDDAELRRQRNTQFDLQWASFVPLLSRLDGQYYVRLARSLAERSDSVFNIDSRRATWTLSSGFTFKLSL
jgi:hypothetical protein